MHSELRMHPRMPTELNAVLNLPQGISVDVVIRNISLGGVMLEGDERMFEAIRQQTSLPVEVDVHFELEAQPVYGRYRLIHTTRKRQDLYQMGFKALTMDITSTELIRALLDTYELSRVE